MNRPIRVLHIFSELDSGGVSNFVMNLYRETDTEEIQFDFALTSGKKSLYDEEVLSRGGRIFYLDTNKKTGANLRSLFREQKDIDAVHSHLFFYSGLALAEAKRAGIPVRIAHAHNAYTGESRSFLRSLYERSMRSMIRRNCTCMLGCSEKACRYVFGKRNYEEGRAAVLPDGIDCARFSYDPGMREKIRAEFGLGEKYVIGHVGHFNPAKNHEKILSVFSQVKKRREDAALLLVGDGKLEQEVRDLAGRLSLEGDVVFAGAHPDVERYYQAMDVFLFPSRFEGFGMAMIEAQAGGLSCLASEVVTRETQVNPATKYLPLDAPDDIWAKTLLGLPGRILDNEINRESVKRFDSRHVAERMAFIYRGKEYRTEEKQ